MQALFIGGTGNISAEVTALCAENGWDVVLLNRGKTAGPMHNERISRLTADIGDEARVAELIKDMKFDVVANFINFTPEQCERDIRLFEGKTKQYIFISSAGTYRRPPANYLITESSPQANPYWLYARNKIACEQVLLEAYRERNFPVTIVRPAHTYGVTRLPVGLHGKNGSWQIIKRMLEGKPVLVQGDGTNLWTLTHSRDFAKGFMGLMGNIRALGEAVHITSDESLTWNQIYQTIGHAFNVEPKLYHVASEFIAACEPSYVGDLIGDKIDTVVFDNSKLKRLVPGYNATIRFDMGVHWSVKYLTEHPELKKEDEDFDRLTEMIIAAQEEALAKLTAQRKN